MSSLRVRAQNKFLDKLGATKPSKNVQFEHAHAGFEKAVSNILTLDTALRGFIISLKGFHTAGQVLVTAIENVACTPESSPELKQFAMDVKAQFVHLDVQLLQDNVKRFEQRVLRPSNGWMGRAASLKNQVQAFHDEKLLFDHYTRKVVTMREARDKRAGAGKPEKPKDVEKLVRNEQKLAAATNSYNKISDATIANLKEFLSTRDDTLLPILTRLIEFRIKYAQQLHDDSRKLQPLVRSDSLFEGVMNSLESFVNNFNGIEPPVITPSTEESKPPVSTEEPTQRKSSGFGGLSFAKKDKSKPPKEEADEPAEIPVKSFSFESFVSGGNGATYASMSTSESVEPSPSLPSSAFEVASSNDWGESSGFSQIALKSHAPPAPVSVPQAPPVPAPVFHVPQPQPTFSLPPPTAPALSLSTPLPLSPLSPSAFEQQFCTSPVTSPTTTTTNGFAPIQPLPQSPGSRTPWDDMAPVTKPQAPAPEPQQYQTSPTSTNPWASFDSYGQQLTQAQAPQFGDFQNLHHQTSPPF